MKKYIIGFVIGSLLFGGIGIVSAYSILSSNVSFTPNNNNWKVSNVEEAIDSLYMSKTSDDYSTDEKIVGTWVDGKPIYQKVYTNVYTGKFNYDERTQQETIVSFGNATNLKKLINSRVLTTGNNGENQEVNEFVRVRYSKPDNNFFLQSYTIYDRVIRVDVIVQYTKTTD